ncbi:MAG: trypsin-like peptidase domain-containing protein [Alphaproteobacteria bacterium]|nr:trypsin-like peptidase domain-containing protein [Alphaproteobacteria bacterium]
MKLRFVLALLALLSAPRLAAAERFQIGDWEGRAVASATPAQCGAISRQSQGTTLALAIGGDGRLQVTATNPRWVAPAGRSVGIIFAFDDRARQSATARVVTAGAFRLEIDDHQGFAGALRGAQRLQIYSSGAPVVFRLADVPAVLDRLADCAGEPASPLAAADPATGNRFLADDPDRGAVRFLTQPAVAAAGTPRFAPRWPMIQRQFSPMGAADTRGAPLTAADVERLARQSIYLLWVDRGTNEQWTNIGSAVAVASDTLLTNCHVVRDSRRLALRQGTRSAAPTLLAADDGADRCFIRVEGMTLTPVPGIRTIASLRAGEAVYSLGNPGGRDRVFGKGAITGFRQREGVTVIQTSAPMAPGSSGGGLFDAWGNLVGVTSFALYRGGVQVGRFAIAAEEFWR